jgi:hypothetical protein
MSFETIPELLPVYAFWLFVSFNIGIPLMCSGSNQLMCYEQDPLSNGALNHMQLLLNYFQPIIDIHWFDGVRECWRLGPLEFCKFVTLLGLWCWLMSLHLLHVGHSLLHSLQHLSLHYQHLLQCWWWRWVGIVVVLIGDTVASVVHLMIVKRFETETETEIDIKIKDSQLYASRDNDD